jgi:hypothetical protein
MYATDDVPPAGYGILTKNRRKCTRNRGFIREFVIRRHDPGPGPTPAQADGRVFFALRSILEGRQRGFAGIGISTAR